ncbi:MAG: WD40/YVTN/BNR-like repeat-containing protein [Candidatus Promineifilaceae bacterium]
MTSLAIATQDALLIVRPGAPWSVEQHLEGKNAESIAVDPGDPSRLYVGTRGNGLWRSSDGGRSWEPAGAGIPYSQITAVAVERGAGAGPGVIFAGTEPSTLSRSEDGGESWHELTSLVELPSSSSWSFPPKPYTHHVRWIEIDPNVEGRLYVAIEAGALVRSNDGGETWQDRVVGGPIDTHSAATHRRAKGRVYSAAGDGYFESFDGGESWSRKMDGLQHRYLVGVAVDPADPDTVVVSAAAGPHVAYRPEHAEAYIYRKQAGAPFELAMAGLPEARGTVASRLATHPDEANVFYAANNHGLFRSEDGGKRWEALAIAWPEGVFRHGTAAVAAFSEELQSDA